MKIKNFNDIENTAFKEIGDRLDDNSLVDDKPFVLNVLKETFPDETQETLEAAYDKAENEWVEAYCPSA